MTPRQPMRIDILTLFPQAVENFFSVSLLSKAVKKNLLKVGIHNLRNWAAGSHKIADDEPYGGGPGMILAVPPIVRAVKQLKKKLGGRKSYVILLTASGRQLNQSLVERLAQKKHLILICGHYQGVDHRVAQWVDAEVSIGDYILAGGEAAALVVADAVARLIPGVVGNVGSLKHESFANGQLEHPQYTRPAVFQGLKVPPVLLQGHHANIEKWRKKEALKRTQKMRPDLLAP